MQTSVMMQKSLNCQQSQQYFAEMVLDEVPFDQCDWRDNDNTDFDVESSFNVVCRSISQKIAGRVYAGDDNYNGEIGGDSKSNVFNKGQILNQCKEIKMS